MKIKFALVVLAIALAAPAVAAQSVTVTGKKVVYRRPKPIMDFKKTFTVNHPRVKASSAAMSKKIEAAISFEKAIPLNIREEIYDVQWLEEADFTVDYNKHGILVVTLSIYGTGAYPSGTNKTVVVDTRTGYRVKPADIFVNLKGLAQRVKAEQRGEIERSIVEIKKDPEAGESEPAALFADADFTVANLNSFSIGDKGVTFMYDYGFPHVIRALQPDGNYFLTWADLSPFIKRGGLLSRIAG